MSFLQDLQFALRNFLQRPGLPSMAILTLALGIGANTAIFSLLYGVALRPLDYPDPEAVVEVWNRWEGVDRGGAAVPEFLAYRDESSSFSAMAALAKGDANLTGGAEPERIEALLATAEIFDVLGIEPFLGRFYGPEEDVPGNETVAVLSYEIWQRRFGGAESLVGETVQLDGASYTVLGILPPGTTQPFDLRQAARSDVWVPLALDPNDPGDFGFHFLQILARLEPGTSRAAAESDLALVVSRVRERLDPDIDDAITKPSFSVQVLPALDEVTGPYRRALWILLAAVSLVLLIACFNVANLLLARGEQRRRELALRSALGAGRSRLVQQLVTESLLLGLSGGGLGVLFGVWALQLLLAVLPPDIPRLEQVRIDPTVLSFTFLVSLAATLLFGLLPALLVSRTDLVSRLQAGGRTAGTVKARLRSTLVVSEIAVAVILVVSAGLLLRSFWSLQQVDPGYRTDNVLTLELSLPGAKYPEAPQISSFFAELRQRLASLPAVEEVGGVTHLPLRSNRGDWNFYPEGKTLPPDRPKPRGDWQVATPGYFEALGIQLIRGRTFEPGDVEGAPLVLMVNRALAERYQQYWGEAGPVGTRVRLGGNDDNPFATIVGVIENIRHENLARKPVPELYLPHGQAHRILGRGPVPSLFLTLRTSLSDPSELVAAVRSEIERLDPELPVSNIATLSQVRARSLALSRFSMALLAAFAGLALLLGAVGTYGLIAYLVTQRTREIGIRIALGARGSEVARGVLLGGLKLAAVGLLVGSLGALALGRVLSSLLYEVSPADPLNLASVVALLMAVTFAASYLPARRAAAVDPVVALREE